MKTKLVLWGSNEKEERVLIAMQLRAADNKVDIWTVPEAIATEEFSQKLMNDWRNNNAQDLFPEGCTHSIRELSLTETILPDELKVEKGDLIQRAQTEWNFAVLSTKLSEAYRSELSEIEDKVNQLTAYSGELWDNLKGFWSKVQDQVKDRNLYREHADNLRDNANAMFEKLKAMRTNMNTEFETKSKTAYEQFNTVLDAVEQKIADGIRNFPAIFDELKHTQTKFRDAKMTREHSAEIWSRLDGAFKKLKEKKFGPSVAEQSTHSAADRFGHRLEGLNGAIHKMEQSIDRDMEELQFQKKRQSAAEGQLESQIRQAKINMIDERVKSKQDKLNEMLATKTEVEGKMNAQKDRDAKRAAQERAAAEIKAQSKSNQENKVVTPAVPVVAESPASVEGVAPIAPVVAETPAAVEAVAPVAPVVKETPAAAVEVVAPIAEVAVAATVAHENATNETPVAEMIEVPVVHHIPTPEEHIVEAVTHKTLVAAAPIAAAVVHEPELLESPSHVTQSVAEAVSAPVVVAATPAPKADGFLSEIAADATAVATAVDKILS